MCICVIVIVGNPVADSRPLSATAAVKSIVNVHLELFLDETKKLVESMIECVKENGAEKSIEEVTGLNSLVLTSV